MALQSSVKTGRFTTAALCAFSLVATLFTPVFTASSTAEAAVVQQAPVAQQSPVRTELPPLPDGVSLDAVREAQMTTASSEVTLTLTRLDADRVPNKDAAGNPIPDGYIPSSGRIPYRLELNCSVLDASLGDCLTGAKIRINFDKPDRIPGSSATVAYLNFLSTHAESIDGNVTVRNSFENGYIEFNIKPADAGSSSSLVWDFEVKLGDFYIDGYAHNSEIKVSATLEADQLEEPVETEVSALVLTDPKLEARKTASAAKEKDGVYTAIRGRNFEWNIGFSARETNGTYGGYYARQYPSRVTYTDTLPEGLGCDTVKTVSRWYGPELRPDQWSCEGNTLTVTLEPAGWVKIVQELPADFKKDEVDALMTNEVKVEAYYEGVGVQTDEAQAQARLTDQAEPKLSTSIYKDGSGEKVGTTGSRNNFYVAEKGAPAADGDDIFKTHRSHYRIQLATDGSKKADFRGWATTVVDNMPCRDGVTGDSYKSKGYDGDVTSQLCQDPGYNPYRVRLEYHADYAGGDETSGPPRGVLAELTKQPEYAPVAVLTDGTRVTLTYSEGDHETRPNYFVPREYWGQVARIETTAKPLFSDDPAWALRLHQVLVYGYADEDLQAGDSLINKAQVNLHRPDGSVKEERETPEATLRISEGAWLVAKSVASIGDVVSRDGEYVVEGDPDNRPKRGRAYRPFFRYVGEPLNKDDTIVIADLLPEGTVLDRSGTGKLPTGNLYSNPSKPESLITTVDAPEVLENFQGSGRTLIRWTIPVSAIADIPGAEPFIQGEAQTQIVRMPTIYVDHFNVALSDPYPDAIPGTYINDVYLGGTVIEDYKTLYRIDDYFKSDPRPDEFNIDGIEPGADLGRKDQIYRFQNRTKLDPLEGASGVALRKAVKGEGDSAFMRAPSVGNATHKGSTVEYEVTVTSLARDGVKNTVIYERVPKAGDRGILIDEDRGSTVDAEFVETTYTPWGGSVEYTTAENPCFPGVVNPEGCVDAAGTWTADPPADPSKVTALRLSFPGKISQVSEKSFRFKMKVPPMSVDDAVWNSVAVVTTPANSNTPLKPIEAAKVGAKRTEITGLNIEKKWVDADGNPVEKNDAPVDSINADVRWTVVNSRGESIEGTVRHAGESKVIPAGGEVFRTVTLGKENDWKTKIDEILPARAAGGHRVIYSLEEKNLPEGWTAEAGEPKELFKSPCDPDGTGENACNGDFSITLTNKEQRTELRLVKEFDVKHGAPAENSDWKLTATPPDADNPLEFTGDNSLPNAQDAFVQVVPGTYSLTEEYAGKDSTQAAGYDLQKIECAVNDGKPSNVTEAAEVKVAAGDKVVCTFTNADKPGTVAWEKVNPDGKLLAGSKWSLKGPDGFTELVEFGEDNELNTAEGAGKFKVEGLPWGTYTLQEVTPPPGFELEDGKVEFVVDGANLEHTFEGNFINKPFKIGNLPLTGVTAQIGLAVLLGLTVTVWLALMTRRRRSELAGDEV